MLSAKMTLYLLKMNFHISRGWNKTLSFMDFKKGSGKISYRDTYKKNRPEIVNSVILLTCNFKK